MRAIGITDFGGPEVLREIDAEPEPLGAGQVRINVAAATVNPTDTGLRSGLYLRPGAEPQFPYVPGMDVAGTLTEIGDGVDASSLGLQVGDHVMGIVLPSGAHGGYRDDIVLPAASVVRVPSGSSDVAASTLPMNGLTARASLDSMELAEGQVLAVTGSAGAYGGYVIQLAKLAGLTVIADAAESDEPLVRELGADIIVRRGDDVAQRIREHFPNGVNGLADGAVQNALVLPAVKDGGVMATVRGYRGDGERGVRALPTAVSRYAQERGKLDDLRVAVEQGHITLRIADTLPAGRAAEAHRRLEAGGVRGRLVLTF